MAAKDDVALRKRQQIAKANRTMFLWVAGASALVGMAVVVSISLSQKLLFNQRVISKKQTAASTLAANIKTFPELKNNIRALDSNQALLDSRAKEQDTALQAVLDALPATVNGTALGSSLQNVLLKQDGVTLESLSVDDGADGATSDTAAVAATGNTIPFTFVVSIDSSDTSKLLELLERLERSIRAIDIQSLSMEMSDKSIKMTVQASASYEPAQTIELQTKTEKP